MIKRLKFRETSTGVENERYYVNSKRDFDSDVERLKAGDFCGLEYVSSNGDMRRLFLFDNNNLEFWIEDYIGRYYLIGSVKLKGKKYLLLESVRYGDEAPAIVMDMHGNLIGETYDSLDEFLSEALA